MGPGLTPFPQDAQASQPLRICYWGAGRVRAHWAFDMGTDMSTNGNEPNLGAHRETYESFLGMTKWGIIFVVAVLILLALFFVR